jgi:2-iminobutanoate/2-iminopropanoate deaminase
MNRETISTPDALKSRYYSQAMKYAGLVFVAGQVAIDPADGKLVTGNIDIQTRRVLDNIQLILKAAGTSLEQSLESLCFLADMADFSAFNETYREYFPHDPPPRTTVQAKLPLEGARIEIRIIAAASGS